MDALSYKELRDCTFAQAADHNRALIEFWRKLIGKYVVIRVGTNHYEQALVTKLSPSGNLIRLDWESPVQLCHWYPIDTYTDIEPLEE